LSYVPTTERRSPHGKLFRLCKLLSGFHKLIAIQAGFFAFRAAFVAACTGGSIEYVDQFVDLEQDD
jgi:hypothetical protein